MGRLSIFSPQAIFPIGGDEDKKVTEYSRVMNRGTNHVLLAEVSKENTLRVKFNKETDGAKKDEPKTHTIWAYEIPMSNVSFWDFELYGPGGREGYSKVRVYLKN